MNSATSRIQTAKAAACPGPSVRSGSDAIWLVRMSAVILVLFAGLYAVRAQPNDRAVNSPARTYQVLKADRLILTVSNRPGAIISTAIPPASGNPVMHPFLSATAHAADEEDALHAILEQSSSFDDFLRLLSQGGYTVREKPGN